MKEQTIFYVLSERDADRLYNLACSLSGAIGELLSARQQASDPYDYGTAESSLYERIHFLDQDNPPTE